MQESSFLTTRQAGELLGEPEWRIRRVADRIDGILWFGGKRAIPREKLPEIILALAGSIAKREDKND